MRIDQQHYEEVEASKEYDIDQLNQMAIDDLESQKIKTTVSGNEALQYFSQSKRNFRT